MPAKFLGVKIQSQMSCLCRRLADALIQPPRALYKLSELGPSQFQIDSTVFKRQDFSVANQAGLKLVCSLYRKSSNFIPSTPCIVYLHGNVGSRCSGLELVETVLREGLSLVTFDFAGCGQSQGEYISLGAREHLDVEAVLTYLKRKWEIENVILWGRSMGAVAAIHYEAQNQHCKGLVLDSPFADFQKLAEEMVSRKSMILSLVVNPLLRFASHGMPQRLDLDLLTFKPIEMISNITCPVMFITSDEDQIVNRSHVEQYFWRCPALLKDIKVLSGGHNNERGRKTVKGILEWLIKPKRYEEVCGVLQQGKLNEVKAMVHRGVSSKKTLEDVMTMETDQGSNSR